MHRILFDSQPTVNVRTTTRRPPRRRQHGFEMYTQADVEWLAQELAQDCDWDARAAWADALDRLERGLN